MNGKWSFAGSRHLESQELQVQPATVDDVPGIVALVNGHALRGRLLPRSMQAVYDSIEDWMVVVASGEVLGCVSLLRYTSGLVEVRSLAVQDQFQGLGIGTHLVKDLIAEAGRRDIPTLFALTRMVAFFDRFGFIITERNVFPEKVWRDCQQCPLLHNCDETAMVLHLREPDRRS